MQAKCILVARMSEKFTQHFSVFDVKMSFYGSGLKLGPLSDRVIGLLR